MNYLNKQSIRISDLTLQTDDYANNITENCISYEWFEEPGCHSDICFATMKADLRFIIENKYILDG